MESQWSTLGRRSQSESIFDQRFRSYSRLKRFEGSNLAFRLVEAEPMMAEALGG